MSSTTELVPVHKSQGHIPIAQMRAVFRPHEVEKRLDKLPPKDHESLRSTYERMLEKGPERFQVKPSGLPAMAHLYDELPNFHDVLDDLRRQLALCHDSREAHRPAQAMAVIRRVADQVPRDVSDEQNVRPRPLGMVGRVMGLRLRRL